MKKLIHQKTAASLALILLFIFSPGKVLCSDEVAEKEGNYNEFAFDLLRKAQTQEQENVFFSPYSISMALGIVYEGTDDGAAKEIERTLYRDLSQQSIPIVSSENKPFDLAVANALWKRSGTPFRSSFIEVIKSKYKAHLASLDVCSQPEVSRKIINAWVSEKTRYKINDLLRPGSVDCETPLIITNAIYFKSDWKFKFPKRKTKEDIFWLEDGSTIRTDFMRFDSKYYYYRDYLYKYKILELPYAGNELSMFVILPNKEHGIEKTIRDLSFEHFSEAIGKMEEKNVFIRFPKFKYDLYFDHLTEAIQQLGIRKIFSSKGGVFSKMTTVPNSFGVSEIIHKAYIEVDEEGTTAAASTGILIYESEDSPPHPPFVHFDADHPFVFIIYHKPTDTVLFGGIVGNPSH